MNLIPEISNTRGLIKKLLQELPHLRDNDNRLLANVWKIEIREMGIDPRGGNINETLKLLAEGKLTSSETIRRTRQKVQEEREELRGLSYKKRKAAGEEVTKNIHAA